MLFLLYWHKYWTEFLTTYLSFPSQHSSYCCRRPMLLDIILLFDDGTPWRMEDIDAEGKCAVNSCQYLLHCNKIQRNHHLHIHLGQKSPTHNLPGIISQTSRATFGLTLFDRCSEYRNLCAATNLRNLILPVWALVPQPWHSIGHPSHAILMQYGVMTLSADRR